MAPNWISGGVIVPVLNDVSQLLGAGESTKAVIQGLVRPHGHKFKVAPKGGDRTRVVIQWPILRPLLILLVLNVIGMLFSSLRDIVFERDPGEGQSVILFWSLYNVVVIAATIAVCVETPRTHVVLTIAPEVVQVIRGRETVSA